MKTIYRMQEWVADHRRGSQYPKPLRSYAPAPEPINFGSRLILLIVGGAATILGTVALLLMFGFVIPAFFD